MNRRNLLQAASASLALPTAKILAPSPAPAPAVEPDVFLVDAPYSEIRSLRNPAEPVP